MTAPIRTEQMSEHGNGLPNEAVTLDDNETNVQVKPAVASNNNTGTDVAIIPASEPIGTLSHDQELEVAGTVVVATAMAHSSAVSVAAVAQIPEGSGEYSTGSIPVAVGMPSQVRTRGRPALSRQKSSVVGKKKKRKA